jgi:hypothetical protein
VKTYVCKMYEVLDAQGNKVERWAYRGCAIMQAKQIGGNYHTVYIEVPYVDGQPQKHLAY